MVSCAHRHSISNLQIPKLDSMDRRTRDQNHKLIVEYKIDGASIPLEPVNAEEQVQWTPQSIRPFKHIPDQWHSNTALEICLQLRLGWSFLARHETHSYRDARHDLFTLLRTCIR